MARPSLQDWILTSRPHPGLRRTIAFGSIRLHPGLGQESRPSRAPGKAWTDVCRIVDGLPKRVPLFCLSTCHSEGGHTCSAQAARSRSPERAATPKNSPGCSRRASSEPAESRVRRSPRDESCRDDTPRASPGIEALVIRPRGKAVPSGLDSHFETSPRVASNHRLRLDSTPPWAGSGEPPFQGSGKGQDRRSPRRGRPAETRSPILPFESAPKKAKILVQLKRLVPRALKGRPLPKTALDAAASIQRASGIQGAAIPPRRVL